MSTLHSSVCETNDLQRKIKAEGTKMSELGTMNNYF